MTVDDLLEKFRENAGKALDNDRILLSKSGKVTEKITAPTDHAVCRGCILRGSAP